MDVFNKMDVQKIYEIKTLAENEAWSLFQEKVGTYMDDQNLLSIAQEVVEECKGLPIALVTVGVALRNKRKSVWEDALEQLRSSNPTNLLDVLPEVYKPLKLSYDYLEDEQARSIFLLCSLFPEDHDIPIKDLTCYALGLSMFGNIGNLQLARNRTDSLVEMLTSRFLLLEGSDEYHVTMHDVVRDVSIFIASKESLINCEKCTWISPYLREGVQLSSGSIFPNLRLLLIDKSVDEKFQMNDNFFEGMTKLNVLSVTDNSWRSSLRSLPHSTQLLKNLRTLILYSCKSLDTISVVGELVNLEILICRYCHSITELPVEMRRLNCMRLLDLSYCEKLKTIAPGIISTLVGLEELKMVESFKKWEAEDDEGRERKNAGLRELESLSNLTCLEIEVEDFALAAEHIHLSSNRLKFDITIGDSHRTYLSRRWSENKMNLHLPREITVGNWILKFLGSVEHMTLVGEGLSNLQLEQALQNLRSLTLGECSMVKRLGNIVFPLLEYLNLEKLDNLEEICDIDGPIPDDDGSTSNIIFKNLKELSLSSLPALKHLCKNDIGAKSHCGRHIKIFPKLEKLTLSDLPRLTTFCKGIESIKFPLLTIMSIWDCPKLMESHVCTTTSIGCGSNTKNSGGYSHDHDDEVDSLHLFCKPEEVAFGRVSWVLSTSTVTVWCRHIPISFFTGLEDLEMSQCNKIKSLFSSSIARNLANLKKLNIRFCWEMVKVIDEEAEKDACPQTTTCLFPSLEFLQLSWLYKLEMFCGWRSCALELPSLKTVDIWQCPKIQRFSFASLTTPNLEEIRMPQMSWGGQGATFSVPKIIIKSKDLNDALQQIFFKVKKEEERERKIYEEMDKKAEEEEKEREEEQERKGDALQQVFKVKEEEERWTKIIEEEEEQERKGEIEEEDKHFSSTNSSAGGGENEERAEEAAESYSHEREAVSREFSGEE